MIWLLKKLLFGHIHVWENQKAQSLENTSGSTGTRILCRCKTCGAWRKYDLI